MNSFKDRVAVITGAASGFGLEVARIAAREGMKLMLVDIQPEGLAAAVKELQATGVPVHSRVMDVSKPAELQKLAEQSAAAYGSEPHFLFNNAGIGCGGLLWEHTEKDWEWALGVNLMSIAHAIRVFVPRMLAAAKADPAYEAHIVNTASMAGLVTTPNLGAYTVTKHAAVAISEQLYQDLALVTEQVRCSVLCPYFVPTGIWDSTRYRPADLDDGAGMTTSKQMAQDAGERAVKGGLVSAAQVAQFVFDGMLANRFYIYSHPRAMWVVKKRMRDIIDGKNPATLQQLKPELGVQMRERLSAPE